MAQGSQPKITEWKIHHTVAGGHSVDRKQFGDFLRSDQGRSMITRAAEAVKTNQDNRVSCSHCNERKRD